MLADKTLQEFLSLGVKGYCQKHHLQCCDLCNDIHCCDNTNPLVRQIKELKKQIETISNSVKHLSNQVKACAEGVI